MQHSFWHEKWQKQQMGWHEPEANPLLLAHIDALALSENSRVFLPLCGKTLDIAWLLAQGYQVRGAELNKLAVEALFAGLALTPTISECGALTRYSGQNVEIYLGDIFELNQDILGPVDAVYDRAALIALPEEMRANYSQHLMALSNTARQLLITVHYDQNEQAGPPFSVSGEEVSSHYASRYTVKPLASAPIEGGLKGKCAADENVFLLTPR
ncbi:MAG: thiopurine S-methyltransferase [Gammaproteobacteria bacterium]